MVDVALAPASELLPIPTTASLPSMAAGGEAGKWQGARGKCHCTPAACPAPGGGGGIEI